MSDSEQPSVRHSTATRWVHALLASAVIAQLATSLVMQGPRKDRAGDWLFDIHQYAGLAALAAVLGFCLVLALRHRRTEAGLLFPWFSKPRRSALLNDVATHWAALKALRLPAYEEDAPLAAAVHGLGLALMTAMGITGAVYFLALFAGLQQSGFIRFDREVHQLLANLVWAYLIAHAGLAVLHHRAKHFSLFEMWSLGRSKHKGTRS